MMTELNIFLSPRKTQELVDWLFTEIEALKSKRKVPQTREKERSREHKKERREKKKKKKSRSRRDKSPIELSSDSDIPEPPPIIHGRRERIRSREEEQQPRRRARKNSRSRSRSPLKGRAPTFSPTRTDDRVRETRKSPKKRSKSRKSPSSIQVVEVAEFGAPPGTNNVAPKSLSKSKKSKRRHHEDRNPFSADSDNDSCEQPPSEVKQIKIGTALPKSMIKPLRDEEERPRSRGSNREEADMAISDVEQMPSDNESSTTMTSDSLPQVKLSSTGHLQSSEKSEHRLKRILESKRLNRQTEENKKSDLREQLDAKYPDPPTPPSKSSTDDTFGPVLPPGEQKEEKTRRVIVKNGSMSPVPTDDEEPQPPPPPPPEPVPEEPEPEKPEPKKIVITRKVLVDTENNQIVEKRSEKDILEDKLREQRASVMATFRQPLQNQRTKLHHMALKGDLYKLRTWLEPSDLTLIDARKATVLHEAARGGFLFQVIPLIKPEMLINADINGVTVLVECAKRSELIQLKTIAWYHNWAKT